MAILQKLGLSSFRSKQRAIINASLQNADVFGCIQTGGGKSLTFQLPALLSSGVTVVVMPLISLINDQIFHLEANAFTRGKAEWIRGGEVKHNNEIFRSLESGQSLIKLL